MALAVAACSGGGSSSRSGTGKSMTHINVGGLSTIDDVAMFIAIKKGLFKAQGLDVTPAVLPNGTLTSQELLSGKLQFAFNNYVTMILADSKGAPLRVVADGVQDQAGVTEILVPKDSPITSVKDLRGKTVAVNALNNVGPLMVDATLQTYGVPADSVKLTVVPFPQMAVALQHHTVDAAWMTEPFVTQSEEQVGAQQLADTGSGAMANFPIAGWATTAKYAQQNPSVVAAFRQAIQQAEALAANRSLVEQVLPTYIKGMTAKLGAALQLDNFPTAVSQTRLQRVADAMLSQGMLTSNYDTSELLLNP
jgi:NitT/TauT family transport system substrate-binding protein